MCLVGLGLHIGYCVSGLLAACKISGVCCYVF